MSRIYFSFLRIQIKCRPIAIEDLPRLNHLQCENAYFPLKVLIFENHKKVFSSVTFATNDVKICEVLKVNCRWHYSNNLIHFYLHKYISRNSETNQYFLQKIIISDILFTSISRTCTLVNLWIHIYTISYSSLSAQKLYSFNSNLTSIFSCSIINIVSGSIFNRPSIPSYSWHL